MLAVGNIMIGKITNIILIILIILASRHPHHDHRILGGWLLGVGNSRQIFTPPVAFSSDELVIAINILNILIDILNIVTNIINIVIKILEIKSSIFPPININQNPWCCQTWNLSKILHRRIFRLIILHRQFHLISTVLVRKSTKNE